MGLGAAIGGISAGASQWLGANVSFLHESSINGIGDLAANTAKRAFTGAVVGGSVSAAFGGSFADGARQGALTSAIAYNTNCVASVALPLAFMAIGGMLAILASNPQTRASIQQAVSSLAIQFSNGGSVSDNESEEQGFNSSNDTKAEAGYYSNKQLRADGARMGFGKSPLTPDPRTPGQKALFILVKAIQLIEKLSGN